MPRVKISELTAASSVGSSASLVIVQDGQTLRAASTSAGSPSVSLPIAQSDVTGLVTDLEALTSAVAVVSAAIVTLPINISDVSTLQSSLDGKADVSHTHGQADVVGLVTALASLAPLVHTHAQSEITSLVTALAALTSAVAVVSAANTNVQSTGVLTGGALSIGTGGAGVATTFTVAAGTGQIVDNTVDPATVVSVSWTQQVDVAIPNIGTQLVTFVAIDSGGNVVQSATDFTPAQMRENIVLGVAVHSNQTTVNAVNQTQIVAYNQGNQLADLFYSLGLFNVSGNVFSANGANLKLNKSAGSVFRRGANYTSLTDNPHIVTTGVLTQASLRMQNQTGAGSASTTDVDVANYDLAGTTTAISPATRFSILRVFLFQSNLIAVQRGQATYLSLAEAKAAIQTETFITNSILAANGLLRGFIVAQANATSLSDTSKVFFIDAGKFGGTSGVGGLSVSTLQNAYDNSSSPEILTDATRGAMTVKRGSGADTDTVIEVQNAAGSTTGSITGNGVINSDALTASELVATDGSKNLASLAVATYPSLAELAYVKGVTSGIQAQLDGKAAASHTHAQSEVTGLVTALASLAPLVHTHAQSEVTGLVTALASLAPTIHIHAQADITGLVTALTSKADSVHTHAAADVSARPFMPYVYLFTVGVTSEEYFRAVPPACSFPAGGAGSKGSSGVSATSSTTFTWKKNGTGFATFVWAANAVSASVVISVTTSFNGTSDELTCEGLATPDATLAKAGILLAGTYS